jgi:hypothetical protein
MDAELSDGQMDDWLAEELATVQSEQQPPPEQDVQPAREIQRGQQVEEYEEHGWDMYYGSHNPSHLILPEGTKRNRARTGTYREVANA